MLRVSLVQASSERRWKRGGGYVLLRIHVGDRGCESGLLLFGICVCRACVRRERRRRRRSGL